MSTGQGPGGGGGSALATYGPAALAAGATIYSAIQGRNAANAQTAAQENAITRLYDPTNPILRGLTDQSVNYLHRSFNANTNADNLFGNFINPLQSNSQAWLNGVVSTGNPQTQGAKGATDPALLSLVNSAGPTIPNGGFRQLQFQNPGTQASLQNFNVTNPNFAPLSFQQQGILGGNLNASAGNVSSTGNAFQELPNPFASQGHVNPGMGVVNAALPLFDRNLRVANAQLAGSAPGRFSTAFASQGNDLNAQAINDFNLFAGQQLQQGAQLQAQERAAAQQFLLGSRGLQQQSEIDAAGRQLQAQMANQGTRLAEFGLNQEAINSYNQASQQAQALFQSGQIDARGLEQQLAVQLQQLGLDATRATNEARLQAQSLGQQQTEATWNANLQGMGQQLQADANSQRAYLDQFNSMLAARLGGANQLMQNAVTTEDQRFNQLAAIFGMGMQGTQQAIDPLLQLQLAGLQYGMPADLNAIVGGSGIAPKAQSPFMQRYLLGDV